jgi:hypothetical protein
VVEHYLDTVGVDSSILPAPTVSFVFWDLISCDVWGPNPKSCDVWGPNPKSCDVWGPNPKSCDVWGPNPKSCDVWGPNPKRPKSNASFEQRFAPVVNVVLTTTA